MQRFCLCLIALAVAAISSRTVGAAGTGGAGQQAWIKAHRVVRVAPDPDFAPIDSIDADGRERGLAADYLASIAKRTGLEFRVVRVKDLAAAFAALRDGKIDLLASVLVTPQRSATGLFSAPYLRLPGAIFGRRGDAGAPAATKDLSGRRVAVAHDTAWREVLAAQAPGAIVAGYADAARALAALADGEVDAYVGDLASTDAALARAKLGDRIELRGQLGVELPVAFGVRKDLAPLKDILDAALAGMSVEEERALRGRWLKTAVAPERTSIASAGADVPASHTDAIAAARTALAGAGDLDADQRKQARDLLDAAAADEVHADQALARRDALRRTAAGADAQTRDLEASLARDPTADLLAWRSSLPERASVDQLEALLGEARAALADANTGAAALKAELDTQLARPAGIRDALAEARTSLARLAATAGVGGSTPEPLRNAQHLADLARQRAALAAIAALEEENRSYEPRLKLLSVQLRERRRTAAESGQHVQALEALVFDRNSAAAADLNAHLELERSELGDQRRFLGAAAEANIALGKELSAGVQRVGELAGLRHDYAAERDSAEQGLARTRERIAIGGVSEAVGLTLLAERRKLKPVGQLQRQLGALDTELAQARIRLIDLNEQSQNLLDVGAAVDKRMARLPNLPGPGTTEVRQGMYRLLGTRVEVLARLTAAQTRLVAALTDAVQELRGLTATTAALTALLDARLLWTPSHAPIDAGWFAVLPKSLAELFRPQRWLGSLSLAAAQAVRASLHTLSALVLLGALVFARYRLPGALERIAAPMRRIRTDRYRLTGQALLLSLVACLPAPFLLWCLGRLWQRAAGADHPFSEALGGALVGLAVPAAVLAFARILNVEKGLAQYHFRWTRQRRAALVQTARRFAWILLPAQFLLGLVMVWGEEGLSGGAGRLIFALAVLAIGAIGWRALAPEGLWSMREAKPREPIRIRQFLRLAFAGIALVLAGLALSGYFLTALTLAGRSVQSLGAVFAVAVLNALTARWLVLGERHLALKRMETKRESGETDAEDRAEGRAELPEAGQITLASVNAQTRRLLRVLTWLALAFLLLWVWSDVAPALNFLGNVTAWESSQVIGGHEVAVHVTLRSLLAAALVFALTWVSTRNLPGLLEVGVLRRLHVDAPTRYAVVAVCRYAIVTVGVILGFGQLGLHWNQLQWMAAAFTVGLGFGLQEIFANFVSGLIVLFERPFRIGDVISIGNIEGSVARIRTRATTLIDWDNREVVVPNKTFITDRLTNWTLSDTVTRVVLRIGVAYAADPRQVRDLLLEIATAEPLVARDPAPTCWFVQISACTFDFDLRVFIGEIGDRNRARSALYTRIAEVFRERNIEMAFPQMDVWFRNPLHSVAAAPGGKTG